ncbi:hypothetical protein BD780_003470 [Clostridium tetanomorphum]|uniref:hypothetical protein n=1 Tax=Clostridium tetanomorphum TaxID=1553 RepID=UPI0004488757|nr:hypothetical protein [Clostridium tetanomorphum]KAJ51241.1 hypothetical protein CTM_14013 [Clostridium tetanomorphum DSM 665]MBP1863669.1 hypothetical protein [Clostridium tetanomorphum]NRS86245.1 hypothetical protein [Clostridium tetanomorphum]SQC00748.1 Uncharacterised protein [Clostridium tetanomorphum]
MSEELYVNTTIFGITLFILCVVVQNKFPELFEEDDNKKPMINIEVDLSNSRQSTWLIIVVTLVLLLPFLNWTISLLYGVYIIYTGYTHRNAR